MNAWQPFSKIIENLNLIVKLERQCVLKDASSGIEGVILDDRFWSWLVAFKMKIYKMELRSLIPF